MTQPADTRTQVSRTATVTASVDDIFALIANPARHAELDGSGTVGAVKTGGTTMRVGEPFVMNMKIFGFLPYHLTSTPVQVDKQAVAWRSGPSKVLWRWEFRPIDAETTEVTHIWDTSEAKMPLLQPLLSRRTARGMEQSLRNLQAIFTRVPR